ncbi:hypothetical protein, partial [Nitrosospira sp. Nsp13]|uniref:hypothetical protein n=1 Tax=Nitrosospira sp. Nsp13 TaxID=1855332 RepID=UPI001C31C17F
CMRHFFPPGIQWLTSHPFLKSISKNSIPGQTLHRWPQVPVCGAHNILPHLSGRQEIFSFDNRGATTHCGKFRILRDALKSEGSATIQL